MKRFLLLSFFAALCMASSCHKDPTPPFVQDKPEDLTVLPPETQAGANTFGFLLNGKLWRPYYIAGNKFKGEYYQGNITLSATKKYGDTVFQGLDLGIDIRKINPLGNYLLNSHWGDPAKWKGGGAELSDYRGYYSGDTDTIFNGKLKLTKLDTINRIIAGTFSITLYNKYVDTIKITKGVFDKKY
jgi:hypothetical protein